MDDMEVALTLKAHEHEIKSLKHRMDKTEEVTEAIHGLATTTALLAKSVETINDDVKEIKTTVNEDVKEIKSTVQAIVQEPADKWNKAKWTIVVAVITAIVSFVVGKLF